MNTCTQCGKQVYESFGGFCSKSCYSKDWYKKSDNRKKRILSVICKLCGNTFSGNNKRKYCSVKCSNASRNTYKRVRFPEEKECNICKSKYISMNKMRKYCSSKCRSKSRIGVSVGTRPCKKCGKIFKRFVGKIYCSQECKPVKERNDSISLKCVKCGSDFIGKKNNKYCSKLCSRKVKSKKISKAGAICEFCGFSDERAIHAHHINRKDGLGIMFLCANHHYIFHAVVGYSNKSENNSKEEVLSTLNSATQIHKTV